MPATITPLQKPKQASRNLTQEIETLHRSCGPQFKRLGGVHEPWSHGIFLRKHCGIAPSRLKRTGARAGEGPTMRAKREEAMYEIDPESQCHCVRSRRSAGSSAAGGDRPANDSGCRLRFFVCRLR